MKLKNNLEFHIDHVFSVRDCFINCIPVWMAANPSNLELIPAKQNLQKNRKSNFTLNEFVNAFTLYNNENKNYMSFFNNS